VKDSAGRLVVEEQPVTSSSDGLEAIAPGADGASGPHAVFVLDAAGQVQWASKAASHLLGAEMGEVVGRSPEEFVHAPARAAQQFLQGGTSPFTLPCRSGITVEFSRLNPAGGGASEVLASVWALRPVDVPFRPLEAVPRSLLESSADGSFRLSTEGRYIDASQSFAEIFGYGNMREFLAATAATPASLYVEPGRRDELLRKLRKHGSASRFESAVLRLDGTTTWISETLTAARDASGRIMYFQGTAQDIGWRKLAEKILNQAEEKWRALVESSGECIVIADRDGMVFFSNTRARQAAVGRAGENIFADFVPASQQALRVAIDRAFATMSAVALPLERADAKGTFYEVRVVPIGSLDDVARVILIASDLTERKRAEEAVREGQRLIGRVADASPAILYVYDFGTERYVYVNHQVEKTLGYGSAAFLDGDRTLADGLLHPDDAGLLTERRRLFADASDDGVVFEYTFRMRHADGRWLWMRARDVVFTRSPDGRPAQIIGMAEDITERQRAGEERERSRAQLRALSARLQEAREEERAAISRHVHDELGQALTAFGWELSKLTDRLVPASRAQPGVAERLRSMSGMIDAMMQIVRKIAAELRPPILDHFGLLAALEWQAQEFQERYRITCEVAERGQPHLADRAISTAVFRIFQEILTNVARHSGATKVRVQLSASTTGCALIVHDNGRGITEGQKTQSLGILGMKERAHLFGGSIEIDGTAGKGTTITVRIPHPADSPASEPRKETLRRGA